MSAQIYAVAQIKSIRYNYEKNIEKHMEYIRLAAQQGSEIVVFPEMSLTGYERELARAQSFTKDDPRLECLKKASLDYGIVIVAGGPLLLEDRLYIASWIFETSKEPQIYVKKYLHPGEELYFQSSMEYDPVVKLNHEQLSFAICYDMEQDEHVECAKNKKSNLYAASIFYSQKGIQSGLGRLQHISKNNSLAVLMSNYAGECWDTDAGGRSSILSANGELVVSADKDSECLVVAENNHDVWMGKVIMQ
ncbi:MAG: carbon-nitrogen hydrolase family protein [Clostridiaceae bacterium]